MPAELALPSALTLASDTHQNGRDSPVGLLALVFTERRNIARRAAVRHVQHRPPHQGLDGPGASGGHAPSLEAPRRAALRPRGRVFDPPG